jgi:hypothetical protein
MTSGDVLVSRPTARADVYDISVVPAVARMSDLRHEDGKETGRQLARRLAVDGWFTCDDTHFLRIATYRTSNVLSVCARAAIESRPDRGATTLKDKLEMG